MYVHLTGEKEGLWTLQLLKPLAQQVAMWERPVGLHGIELPVLAAGIYTLRAEHAKGSRMHTRVVIAR
jgi:hypothetical protein